MKIMKIMKISILTFTILFSLISANEKEEIKTINKDGIIYKVNSSSNHLFALSSNDKPMKKNKKLTDTGYKFYTTFGHVSPLGENLRTAYDPAYSLGCVLELPHSFNLFTKQWDISVSGKHTRFNNNTSSDLLSFSIFDIMSHASTKFGPILLNLGVGITNGSTVTNNNGTIDQISISAKVDIGYYIIEKNDFDLILNMSLQETGLGPLTSENGEKSTSELMGLNIQFGKSINF